MNRNMIYAGSAIVMAVLLGFSWGKGESRVNADDDKAAAGNFAVVDLAKVYAAHKKLRDKSEDLRRNSEQLTKEMQEYQATGLKLQQEYQNTKKGTPRAKEIEDEVKKTTESYNKLYLDTLKLQKANLDNVMEAYVDINEEVTKIARDRGYRLVLNFSSEPVVHQKDPQKRQLLLSRQVLHANGIDITDEVISAFN
jgi:Skp family chaperone for outer membrane proteins